MGKYKGFTPSRQRANEKYLTEKVDTIIVRVPKGKKSLIQTAADKTGKSLSRYCADAIDRALESDLPDSVDLGESSGE